MPGRILIVDDLPSNRMLVRAKLAAAYYDVIEAPDGETAIEIARAEGPDLILLDVVMPGIDGFETCRTLKSDPATMHIPVVMLTALDKRADRLRGLEAGADDFLSKPFDDTALLSRVEGLTRMKMMIDELRLRHDAELEPDLPPMPALTDCNFADARVLLITGSLAFAGEIAREIHASLGCGVDTAPGEAATRALIASNRHDAFVIGPDPADGDPMRIASLLRSRPSTRRAALMMMFRGDDTEGPRLALEIGVWDYLSLPPDFAEMAARLKVQLKRKHYSDHLRRSMHESILHASSDPLTGLANRRQANARLGQMLDDADRQGISLAAMMLDLDQFKAVNDAHGHQVGDAVLVEFAKRLNKAVRSADLVARIGGEEFLVVMQNIRSAQASAIAERIRRSVADPSFPVDGVEDGVRVTVSIGLALHRGNGETAPDLLARADAALYDSKHGGRNLVTLSAA